MTSRDAQLSARLEKAVGERPSRVSTLPGGCVADVRLAEFPSGARVVVKIDDREAPTLDIEAMMLDHLRSRSDLPVPRTIHAEPSMLVLEHIENDGTISSRASEQEHAAALLAALHAVRPDPPDERRFGFERDTLIGPLAQRNGWGGSWVEFFRDRRLLAMTDEALRAGALPREIASRLRDFAQRRLHDLIDEPDAPSLVHGDAWGGNILVRDGRVAAFIDPALSYSHAEVELAFGTLFGTFGERFFDAYRERRPIAPGFYEARREVYNLYPLLVHVRLFGGGYVSQVDATLRRFGV